MASPRATQRNQPAEAWRIMRWRSRHWAHREQLAEGVALTMLRIPAGSFEMGHWRRRLKAQIKSGPCIG